MKIKTLSILLICYFAFNQQMFASDMFKTDPFIDVLHYTINLDISNITSKQISGNTELIILSKKSDLHKFDLDLLQLTVDSVKVIDKLTSFSVLKSYNYDGNKVSIDLNKSLNLSDTVITTIYYHGFPQKDLRWGGFYFTNDAAYNYGVGMAAEPPTFGRVWYPCVDNFTDRATYNYNITVNKKHKAVCCGQLKSTTNNSDGTKTFHWQLKQNIPTYLSSVAVSDYAVIRDSYDGIKREIPIEIYVKPKDSIKAIESFRHLKDALRIFENRFGSYVWSKVGYVSTPFRSGAMEHATNIAYPYYCSEYSESCDFLLMHELSHHWFGDLVTCASEKDMWLNEGWASYCEAIFAEGLYGKDEFKNYVRKNHAYVLSNSHVRDNGYRAIYGIPHAYTYGSTVYDKGADVLHTLRGYLGDSLFFATAKEYLKTFAFQSITTPAYKKFMSEATDMNLDDFFHTWVLSPGFHHFAIDSFTIKKNHKKYNVSVFIRQRLYNATEFSNSNIMEVCFMDKNGNKAIKTIQFSGEYSKQIFELSFVPEIVMLDPDEKISDATVDNYMTIKSTGEYEFPNTNFTANIEQIKDSVFIRVVCNFVAPEKSKNDDIKIELSDTHYWNIEGIIPLKTKGVGIFEYHNSDLKNQLKQNIILLYRANNHSNWVQVKFFHKSHKNKNFLITEQIKTGSYSLGLINIK